MGEGYVQGNGNHVPPDHDAALQYYLALLVRKWWVVAVVFALTLGVAMGASRLADSTSVYEARTRLLIVDPVSNRIIGEPGDGTNPLSSLSIDTLSALVAANDLLETVITTLDLRDTEGQPLSPKALGSMMESEIETANEGTHIPLLTVTVRDDDPDLVARIATTL